MIIRRTQEIDDNVFKVGDVIGFTLTTGEEVGAMAMKEESDGTIFAFVDCLEEERPMRRCGEKDLETYLNEDLLQTFPANIREAMIPFEEGIYLRLMTQKEVFGEKIYDSPITDDTEQFEPMKNRRNRIAFQGKDGKIDDYEWYWLRDPVSAACFASVGATGLAACGGASYSLGIRPAFAIKHL